MMSQDNRLIPVGAGDRAIDRSLGDIAQPKSYGATSLEPTNLRQYLFVVLKRKWLILGVVLMITSLVTIQEFRSPPVYEAATTIRIDQKQSSVLRTGQVVINADPDPNFWGTQLTLLQNPSLARQVVLTLDLHHNPVFLKGKTDTGVFSSLRRIFNWEKRPAPSKAISSPTASEIVSRDHVLSPDELAQLEPYEDAIIEGQTIEPLPNTSLITIRYRHSDPEITQKVADTLAEIFVNNNYQRETAGSDKADVLLSNEIANLQTKIKHDQEVKFNFARAHGLPLDENPESNIELQRLATLSKQLLDAENDRKNLQSIYEAARREKDPSSIPGVVESDRITKLKERISKLKEQREDMRVTFTDEWPGVKKIDASLKPLEDEVARAPLELIAAMKSRYEAAQSKENSLRSAYNSQRGTTTQQTRDKIDMTAISQEIETNKQYLNTLLQRKKELDVTKADRPNEVSIETPSRYPHSPIGPARFRNIIIAFFLSFAAGVGLAFLLDFLDDSVKTVDDVDRYIHLPALALIPDSGTEKPRLKGAAAGPPSDSTALALIEDVRSPVAESYRHLRTSLLLSTAGQAPRTILVTSSQPSEGKTTTAVNTAVMLAQTGADVLIIDCDLRRPRLHTHFGMPNTHGLTNCLSGESDMDGLMQAYEKLPNLKVMTSGPVPPNPAELLGSDEMRKVLAALSERFAHIIVDSPPCISFTDAAILSTLVDGVILVVHGGHSSRAVVRRAKQQLVDVGAHIFGVVLNKVKIEAEDYYYGYYSKYYYGEGDGDADGGGAEGAAARGSN
ncbi:MAG: polysaccharide biosynthesis transport protein [Blastocatellia bacterium]|jgi:capsular exopolysaccharide synthesis family protein|nr:polysaccharide biosynthesis transport protein [Blastocatellia bacterium]